MSRRRGRGEGSISQRPDGRWMGRVDLGWQHGRRCYKAVYGRTRREVANKLPKLLRAAQQGVALPDERQTVEQYLGAWLEHIRPRLRPRAWLTYEQAVRLHLTPGIGKMRLAQLAPAPLGVWFRTHQEQGSSARNIRYARTVLRAALNQALKWGLVAQNAAALVEPPRHRAREIAPLSPEQSRTLLKAAGNHRLGALVSVALALGLRLGEALGLRWADIDLESGTLKVRQALQRMGGDSSARRQLRPKLRGLRTALSETTDKAERKRLRESREQLLVQWRKARTTLQTTEPKSARSRRTISLPSLVVTALKAHRVRQLEERLAAGGAWEDSGLVFTTPFGTPLDGRNVTREFKGLLAAARLPNVRFHDLRHTAATLLLAQGVDPRTIMETLGHSQISLTLNTYSHVLPTLQRSAAEKMDAVLRSS